MTSGEVNEQVGSELPNFEILQGFEAAVTQQLGALAHEAQKVDVIVHQSDEARNAFKNLQAETLASIQNYLQELITAAETGQISGEELVAAAAVYNGLRNKYIYRYDTYTNSYVNDFEAMKPGVMVLFPTKRVEVREADVQVGVLKESPTPVIKLTGRDSIALMYDITVLDDENTILHKEVYATEIIVGDDKIKETLYAGFVRLENMAESVYRYADEIVESGQNLLNAMLAFGYDDIKIEKIKQIIAASSDSLLRSALKGERNITFTAVYEASKFLHATNIGIHEELVEDTIESFSDWSLRFSESEYRSYTALHATLHGKATDLNPTSVDHLEAMLWFAKKHEELKEVASKSEIEILFP